MSLEQRIKDTEKKLAILKAYKSVGFRFGKDVPAAVQDDISKKLKDICQQLANDESPKTHLSQLTDQELDILKQLADTVLKRTSSGSSNMSDTVSNSIKKLKPKALMATLMSTEGVPRQNRKNVSSLEKVKITKYNNENATILTKSGYKFVVPIEDLEFDLEE